MSIEPTLMNKIEPKFSSTLLEVLVNTAESTFTIIIGLFKLFLADKYVWLHEDWVLNKKLFRTPSQQMKEDKLRKERPVGV